MNHRDAVEFFGILCMGTCSFLFAALWWAAFLTGDAIRMTISNYGERWPEVVVWFVVGPLMLFGLSSYLVRLREA